MEGKTGFLYDAGNWRSGECDRTPARRVAPRLAVDTRFLLDYSYYLCIEVM